MKTGKRVLIAACGIVIGLLMMGASYDNPLWYFMALGYSGALLFFGSLMWVIVGFGKKS